MLTFKYGLVNSRGEGEGGNEYLSCADKFGQYNYFYLIYFLQLPWKIILTGKKKKKT